MTFYNCFGAATAYIEENDLTIYLFSGEPVAYIYNDTVYGFNGVHLGWIENGWIRDLSGCCVFFSETASGSGPVKPVKQVCPIKSVKQIMPIKSIRQIRHVKAVNQLSWSQLSGVSFFK